MAIIFKGEILKSFLSKKRVGIFVLLFPMLLLPMLHLHPAYDHVHGEKEDHQHQSVVHADFFHDTVHRHEHHDEHDQQVRDLGVSINTVDHASSQIDLLPLHIGQSFQFSSVFKRNLMALDQGLLALYRPPNFQRGAPIRQNAPSLQVTHFSSPSLRAPPYFA